MEDESRPDPTVFVIFGASGDLTWRKLMPAIYNLYLSGWMPEDFAVVGLGADQLSDTKFRDHLRDGVNKFSRTGKVRAQKWKEFAQNLHYHSADLNEAKAYKDLDKTLSDLEKKWGREATRIYYLALPPSMIAPVARHLEEEKLNENRECARLVVEKPFGHDLDSARRLNRLLTSIFAERQIYRIDHYLGKETVQNILAFRFGNALFEPVWNRQYIDHIQITVAEEVGVGHRGAYYDKAGALRDIIQNHMLQILSLIAMEAPVNFDDDEIRNKKVDVLRAIRPILPEQVQQFAIRGQYSAGVINGEYVKSYRDEDDVAEDSYTETYAALKFYVDNWRWQGVPFFLRTGKRMPAKISEVSIQFKPVPHQTFPTAATLDWRPNRLLLAIQPEEGILLRFEVKKPGPTMHLSPVMMQFYYREAFKIVPPEAYETLLLDVMKGDATLFLRRDQTDEAWAVISPVLDVWNQVSSADFPNYKAGTWGPEEANTLIAQDGISWITPTPLQCHDETAQCSISTEQRI